MAKNCNDLIRGYLPWQAKCLYC